MAYQTFAAPIAEFWGETLSLGTTITSVGFPPGVQEVMLLCDDDFHPQFAPRIIKCLVTTDNEATFTDYTSEVTDRDTSTSLILDSLDTAANGDYWYLAAYYKFEGATIDVGATDSTSATMTGYYWNGTSWADVTITDGTSTFATDATITFTRPTAWEKTTLDGLPGLYVIRFQVSETLDSEVEVDEIALLPNITDNPAGHMETATGYVMSLNTEVNGALSADSDGSSKTLDITWIRHTKFGNG